MRCRRRMSRRSWDSCRSRWSLTLSSDSIGSRLATGIRESTPRWGDETALGITGRITCGSRRRASAEVPRAGDSRSAGDPAGSTRSAPSATSRSCRSISRPNGTRDLSGPPENPVVLLAGRVVLSSEIELSAGAATGDEARALRIPRVDRSPRRSFRWPARLRPHPGRPASRVAARRLTRPLRPYRAPRAAATRSRPPSPLPAIHSA